MTAAVATRAVRPRRPALDHDTARTLMTTEYARVVAQLSSLSSEEWQAPTCNAGWDVRALAAHLLGMVAMAASVREQLSQLRAARRRGGETIDALTALQVEKYDGWSPQQLVAEYARLAPAAVKGRTRLPAVLRNARMPEAQLVGPGEHEQWTFGYLLDVVLTRDPWMHRTDIAAATGRALELTPGHDGVVVDDVVREWARRHGRPCSVTLTGPLARAYSFGPGGEPAGDADGPSYTCDAVELCRLLSGRGSGEGLLATRVPF